MQRHNLVIAALIPGVLLLSVLLFSFLFRPATRLPNFSSLVSSVVNAGKPQNSFPLEASLQATVYKEYGEVSLKLPNGNYVAMSGEEQMIPPGTSVKTSAGLAHVVLPDSSMMSVAENTEVLVEFGESSAHITQFIGRTFHRVVKIITGHSYEVETPTTLATVRGTQFGVDVDDSQESAVYVTESTVEVGQYDDSSGSKVIKEKLPVVAGSEMVVPPKKLGKPVHKTMPAKMNQDPWVMRNKMTSEKFINPKTQKDKSMRQLVEELKAGKNDVSIQELDRERADKDKNNSNRFDKLHEVPKLKKIDPTPSPASQLPSLQNSNSKPRLTNPTPNPSPSPSPKLNGGNKSSFDKGSLTPPRQVNPTPTPSPESAPSQSSGNSAQSGLPKLLNDPQPSPAPSEKTKIR